ncbi:MAG: hypothetical protein NAOJABEB_02968 [Steroidobacteraceae bacterium]|nr:hypothetical protein [Steroidobacteraceae bacterium]
MRRQPTDAELVREKMTVLGVDEVTARFILAIERGETTGDAIEVDDDGNEIRSSDAGR